MTKVLYPGSFDPITKGHMNILLQASELFDEVIIAIMQNPKKKNCFFTLEERFAIIQKLYQKVEGINVVLSQGLTVDVAQYYQCKAIIRGFRNSKDYDYEIQLQQINRELSDNKINTIFLFADPNYQFISSSMAKELFYLDKNISKFVDPLVEEQMLVKRRVKHE